MNTDENAYFELLGSRKELKSAKKELIFFLFYGNWIVQNDGSVLRIIFGIEGDPPCQLSKTFLFEKVSYESKMTIG